MTEPPQQARVSSLPIWAAILVVAVAAPAAQIGLLCTQRALGIRAASHPVCALARPDPPVP